MDEDSEIRNPDKSYTETLLNEEYDIEFENVLKISIREYQKNLINENNQENDTQTEELQLAMEYSNEEYLREIIQESIEYEKKNEEKKEKENKEKEKRINSLKNFCIRIKSLTFREEDILLKKYIESVLDEYFQLKIDYVIIENNDIYNQLYKLIDSYYLEPFKKNYKKFAITEEEDKILRILFLKKN